MAKSVTPAQNGATNGEVSEVNALERLNKKLGFLCRMDADSPDTGRINTIEAILSAESEEDFWNADEKVSTGGRDLQDVEIRILDFTVKKGTDTGIKNNIFRDPESGAALYLDVRAVRLDSGEEMVFNTSAPLVVAKILGLQERGMLPQDCVIRGTETANGTVLKLKPVPKRAVPGTVA